MGLYYPYVHFRSDEWLKLAALYWPKMARMMPTEYPVRDSETVKVLAGELDFIVDVNPKSAASEIDPMFRSAIRNHEDSLRERYGVWFNDMVAGTDPDLVEWVEPHVGGFRLSPNWRQRNGLLFIGEPRTPFTPDLGPRSHRSLSESAVPITGLCMGQVGTMLRRKLVRTHLAIDRQEMRPWLGVHPNLAWVYTCALADTLARRGRLIPATDQTMTHLFQPRWTEDTIAAALLQPHPGHSRADVTSTIGALAMQLVTPANLRDIPVRKIVEVRKRYAADFHAFTNAVESTGRDLTEFLSEVHEPAAFEAYIEGVVQREFTHVLDTLRKDLREMNIDHGFTAASVKFELPAAALSTGAGLWVNSPVIAGAGAVGFGLLSLRHTLKNRRRAALTPSAASYLLQVEKDLTPRSLLGRMADGLARIAGTRP
ncbi:hypothetical protein RKD23_000021 [Streptomyces sp. SAI-170]|uniref:DUF6236 family protein n=1 Tax=Streptomyces sp. SAI-170 TaxID=3377729 RepID=UPI003C79C883